MAQPSLLIAGCGDIGSGVARDRLGKGWQVVGLRRNPAKLPEGVEGRAVDFADPQSIAKLGELSADYLLLTLTPAAYNREGYTAIFDEGLQALLARFKRPPKLTLFVSSTGVYDQADHQWVDETSETAPSRFSGQALLTAEQHIAATGWPHSIVRFSGIYGPGRNQMINKVRQGECTPATPLHYSNRIHRDDCVGFLLYLLDRAEAGEEVAECYLGSDSAPTPIQDIQAWLAGELGVPYRQNGQPVARTGSKRCDNRRLQESGYTLRYPDFKQGFSAILPSLEAD